MPRGGPPFAAVFSNAIYIVVIECGGAGRLECDHLDRDWRGDPYDMANLQTLCRTCHIEKTARENTFEDTERRAWRALIASL